MIQCYIDGKVAYPDTSQKIKVTYSNQYIEDSGSYTYQVTFPMAVRANKLVFGNVDRFNVRKSLPDYEECRLLVDNRLIISGKGTVTAITNDTVKLQIVGGKSRIKYNSKMTSHYIDEIDYPEVKVETFEVNKQILLFKFAVSNVMQSNGLGTTSVIGEKGKYAFNPTYDETNDIICNNIWLPFFETGASKPGGYYLYDIAVQPYLLYVLEHVLTFEGYTINRNDLDKDPWNRLVICSARKGTKIKNALPHWSSYTFIENVRKLFNVSFVFDEVGKTVSIIKTDELTSNDAVRYDCEDEFSVEHQDDAIKSLTTSNIAYDWPESANRDYTDYIPKEVLKAFDVLECDGAGAAVVAADKMTQKQRMTTIFKIKSDIGFYGDTYKIYRFQTDSDGNATTKEESLYCGYFTELVRDEDSESTENLKIVPVAMTTVKRWKTQREGETDWLEVFDMQAQLNPNLGITIPSITNDKEASVSDLTLDQDEQEYYISVDDALQDTGTLDSEEEDEDEKMQVMFQSDDAVRNYFFQPFWQHPESQGKDSNGDWIFRYPVNYTDYRQLSYITVNQKGSMSLCGTSSGGTIGSLMSDVKVDSHNQICIKFVTDDLPDPSNIFVFRGKRYICQKIEVNVDNKGVAKEKTGYFYELLG